MIAIRPLYSRLPWLRCRTSCGARLPPCESNENSIEKPHVSLLMFPSFNLPAPQSFCPVFLCQSFCPGFAESPLRSRPSGAAKSRLLPAWPFLSGRWVVHVVLAPRESALETGSLARGIRKRWQFGLPRQGMCHGPRNVELDSKSLLTASFQAGVVRGRSSHRRSRPSLPSQDLHRLSRPLPPLAG